jgi:hypothetical protein
LWVVSPQNEKSSAFEKISEAGLWTLKFRRIAYVRVSCMRYCLYSRYEYFCDAVYVNRVTYDSRVTGMMCCGLHRQELVHPTHHGVTMVIFKLWSLGNDCKYRYESYGVGCIYATGLCVSFWKTDYGYSYSLLRGRAALERLDSRRSSYEIDSVTTDILQVV